jgi:hypothetical protein
MLNSNTKFGRQAGATLIELLIGLALSMIVVSSMVGLMSNSMGTASRIIQMTQLSDELRNTMSMATRDLRRANYNANAYQCYANASCGIDGLDLQVGAVTIENKNCMIFNLDRDQDGAADSYRAGGFRLATDGGPGYIEMWVGEAGDAPDCSDPFGADGDNWLAMTDPQIVDITQFEIDDSNSKFADLLEEGGGTLRQTMREILIQVTGELVLDDTISRHIQDTIRVRNDHLWDPNA